MRTGIVYGRIPPADPALVAQAFDFTVADLHEALGPVKGRMALMSPDMRPLGPAQKIVGQAVTAYNFAGDNLMIHKALQLATAGQVLVLSNGGIAEGALWGDVAATFARRKNLAGVIAHGAVRDVDALREMGFPVWSTAISPAHSEKRGPGAVNVPMVCDGALVNPGDIIFADGDGVLVIPREYLAQAVEGARSRCEKERELREKLNSGSDLFDLLGLEDSFTIADVEIVDATWRD